MINLIFLACVVLVARVCSGTSHITLTYINTMSAASEVISENIICVPHMKHFCYGGAARVATRLKMEKERNPSTVFIYAGDYIFGSFDYMASGADVIAAIAHELKPDVMIPGPRDWTYELDKISDLISKAGVDCPIANLNRSQYTQLPKEIKSSLVINKGGHKIGIIGFYHNYYEDINPNLHLVPELPAIGSECKQLEKKGVGLIIIVADIAIYDIFRYTSSLPCGDVFVQLRHSVLMYNGMPPTWDKPVSEHPRMEYRNNSQVAVVGSTVGTQYLGYLDVTLDDDGGKTFKGNPIHLSKHIKEDPAMLQVLKKYLPAQEALIKEIVGRSKVFINSQHCRESECSYGNLITDTVIFYYATNIYKGKFWSDASIAIIDTYGWGQDYVPIGDGSMSKADLNLLDFTATTMRLVTLNGSAIIDAFQQGFNKHIGDLDYRDMTLLLLSGMKIIADVNKPIGQRLVYVEVLCAECKVPHYSVIDPKKDYKVIISERLAKGLKFPTLHAEYSNSSFTTQTALEWYIKKFSPIYPIVEGRVNFVNIDNLSVSIVINFRTPFFIFGMFVLCYISLYLFQ